MALCWCNAYVSNETVKPDVYRFKKILPSKVLQAYVNGYWLIQHHGTNVTPPLFLVHDGYAELLFTLKGRLHVSTATGSQYLPTLGWLGQLSSAFQMNMEQGTTAFFIKLQPAASFLLSGMPQHLALNTVIDLKDIYEPQTLSELHHKLVTAQTLEAAIPAIETWLLQRLSIGNLSSPVLPTMIQRIFARSGNVSIDELKQGIQLSNRYLEKLFRQHIGLSPKQYTQLIRVKKASNLIAAGATNNFEQLACQLGFYDHAHFSRTFRRVAGRSPSQFMAYAQQFPILEKDHYFTQWDY